MRQGRQGKLGRGLLVVSPRLTVRFPPRGTDRSGMENTASVEQLQETLIRALRTLILKNHPTETSRFTKLLLKLPDLRTLNNMHSEKLLSFRIDAQ